ncbi:DUF2599 domain-containing protein [Amycolatopsis azurea]|uniref:DUF2599 domain-containing protein n=1 Tax=Amycolatopsis azurea TaxID=36819 RepID=UPI0038162D80
MRTSPRGPGCRTAGAPADEALMAGVPAEDINSDSAFQQFMCHWSLAGSFDNDRSSWNLDPDRPAVGTLPCMATGCSPS